MQTCDRALFVDIAYLGFSMKAANSTMNLYEAFPPNYRREPSQIGLRVPGRSFVNTKRHERARIPESTRFFQSSYSLSAKTARIALFPLTLPVGIFRRSFTLSRTLGRRSFPAATRTSS